MNEVRPARLDAVDEAILGALVEDGRLSNAALARQVGVAESTSIHRVRALQTSGVIMGIHARVDLAQVGLPIEAVIHVQMESNSRRALDSFRAEIADLPGLLMAFSVAGVDDYILHVAVADPVHLRDLVTQRIASHPAVGHTETQLVFEVIRGRSLKPWAAEGARD